MLITAAPSAAAIAHVQTVTCSANATSCTTGAVTTTTGNLFVASSGMFVASTFVSVTDSKSNSYTGTGAVATLGSQPLDVRQDYKANGAGGASHTFTLTTTASFISFSVSEISGASTSPLDQTATGTTDVANTAHTTSSTSTTAQANELLVGAGTSGGTTTFSTDGGWTEVANIAHTGSDVGIISGVKTVAAVSTYAYTFTTGSSTDSAQVLSTWKESSGNRQRCIGCGTDKKVIQ